MKVAFAGSFAARIAAPVRAQLSLPCEFVVDDDETAIGARLHDADVLVSMAFSAQMRRPRQGCDWCRFRAPGLDRIDRRALRPGMQLANAYGHETGIAEYIMGAMIALTRSFGGSIPRCVRVDGKASGQSARPHRHSGPSWQARPSASWASVTSDRRSLAVRRRSICRWSPCDDTPSRTRRTALR